MQEGKTTRSITIDDVAREAGVSIATVSRVINNTANVRPDKFKRVMSAMTQLGFVVNPHARSLAGGRTNALGLLVADVSHPFNGELVRGIEAELAKTNFDLILYTTQRRKTKEAAHVATLTHGLADGLILVVPRNAEQYVAELRHRQFPYVIVDNQIDHDPGAAVHFAYRQSGYDATRYLLDLGHRRIGFIAGLREIKGSIERFEGYCEALHDAGLPLDPDLIVQGDFFQPSGFTATEILLALAHPPTAIFATNDLMAFGVMDAARVRGLRIPEDLSIIGFDDIPQASHVHPPLTTMHTPIIEAGALAVRMLIEQLDHPDKAPQQVTLTNDLVIRGTTQAPVLTPMVNESLA